MGPDKAQPLEVPPLPPSSGSEGESDTGKDDAKPTRSGCKPKQVQWLINAMTTETAECTNECVKGETFCPEGLHPDIFGHGDSLLAFKSTMDLDTLCMHQAMKEPDVAKFLDVMDEEVMDQVQNGNFAIIPKNQLPLGALIVGRRIVKVTKVEKTIVKVRKIMRRIISMTRRG